MNKTGFAQQFWAAVFKLPVITSSFTHVYREMVVVGLLILSTVVTNWCVVDSSSLYVSSVST